MQGSYRGQAGGAGDVLEGDWCRLSCLPGSASLLHPYPVTQRPGQVLEILVCQKGAGQRAHPGANAADAGGPDILREVPGRGKGGG